MTNQDISKTAMKQAPINTNSFAKFMKRIMCLFLMTVLLIMCVGCGRNQNKDSVEKNNQTEGFLSVESNVSEVQNHSVDGFFAPGGGIKTYTFNNGIAVTAKDVWIEKFEWSGEQHTWIAVSIEAENTSREKKNVPDFRFYADDYTIKEDSLAYSIKDDYLRWETEYNSIEGGRKMLGVYYILLDDFENYTRLECMIGDAVFVIRDTGYDDITHIIGE